MRRRKGGVCAGSGTASGRAHRRGLGCDADGAIPRRRERERERERSFFDNQIDDCRSVSTTPLVGDTAAGHSWPSIGGEYYTPALRSALCHAFQQHTIGTKGGCSTGCLGTGRDFANEAAKGLAQVQRGTKLLFGSLLF